MNPLIILAGPTATGKSETAAALAEALDTEIISADSLQVYRHFDIGTAKPGADLRARVRHHLLDICEPEEAFTAFDFKKRAEEVIDHLHAQNRVPVLAGGTGLYLQVLTDDLDCGIRVDDALRDEIRHRLEEHGPEALHRELSEVDPASAEKIRPTDPSRIERALTVFYQTGTPLSRFHAEDQPTDRYEIHMFVLEMDRERLYDAVNRRVDGMMQEGWLDEVRGLRQRGVSQQCPPFKGIGYTQLLDHLEGRCPLVDAVEQIKRETRRYAKRQITWFKKQRHAQPLPVEKGDTAQSLKEKILSRIPQSIAALAVALFITIFNTSAALANPLEKAARLIKYSKPNAACELLQPLLADPDESLKVRAGFLTGKCLMAQGKVAEAQEQFRKALPRMKDIEDYVRLELARANLENGAAKDAFEETSYLLQQFPQSRVAPQAEMTRARALHALGQTEQAIFFLEEAVARWTDKEPDRDFDSFIPEMLLEIAVLQEQQKLPSRAYLSYRKIHVEYPNHPVEDKAGAGMKRLTREQALKPPPFTQLEVDLRVEGLLAAARYREARDILQDFRSREGKKKLDAQWYFDMASSLNGLRKRPEMIEVLKEFIQTFPGHTKVQQARYKIGRTAWNLGRNGEALNYFKTIFNTTSSTKWKTTMHYFLGRVYEDLGNRAKAREHLDLLLNMKSNSSYLKKAAWRLGWMALRAGKLDESLEQFKKNLERWPDTDEAAKSLFWIGKLHELSGRKQEALAAFAGLLERFPYSYYGVRAEQKLQTLKDAAPAQEIPEIVKTGFIPVTETPPGLDRSLTEEEQFHYGRALALADMGLFDAARLEARRTVSSIRKNLSGVLWASNLYIRAKAYPEAMRVLFMYRDFKQPSGERELPVAFWKNFFPLAYFDLIREPAQANAMDPFFVDGLIRQESLFDDEIVSPAGARGLMQIMPETGRRLFSTDDGGEGYDPDALFDARLNVRLGIKFLGQLARRYGNKGTYLLISYNAGPHVLEKWLKRFEHIQDEDVFIESIPYPETRGYVKRVMRNYGIYHRLYKDSITPEQNHRVF